MYWILYAIASIIFIGSYNLFLEGTKEEKKIAGDENIITQKHIYLSFILLVSGVINVIILFYYHISDNKQMEIFYKKKIPSWKIVIPSILISLYMFTNMISLSDGGGIAGTVFMNGSAAFVLLGGAYLFKDKINMKIIISLILASTFIYLGIRESERINK